MTAGCRFTPGTTQPAADHTIVQCDCPVVNGPYQIGQTGSDVACAIPSNGSMSYLWSAAVTVKHGDPKDQH